MCTQSAENCKGFSETTRQLPETEDFKFWNWFAGIIDGDGNFDIRIDPNSNKRVLKQIRIKLHNRDIRILTRIRNYLHIGAVWIGLSPMCLKLSNSRDILKFLIPSSVWKYISGWTNYSDKVTSQEMIESEMDYCGSKSIILSDNIVVKEQRVDGSCIEASTKEKKSSMLRCTLMDFERSYQIKTRSNQINSGQKYTRSFHTTKVRPSEEQNIKNLQIKAINPWYLTGFVDAEGSFLILIRKNKNLKIGWNVELRFQISLHEKDAVLLEQIKNYFGVGTVYKDVKQTVKFSVLSIKDISVIISHFDKYCLITQKRADYELFKQAFNIISNKEHLTQVGLLKIVALKASLNLGLSEQLKAAFTEGNDGNTLYTPIDRPLVTDQAIKDPYWLAGFTDGDGHFGVSIKKYSSGELGYYVSLQFDIIQHARDVILLRSFEEFFDCGKVYLHSEDAVFFKVTKLSDITDKIIPFFKKHPLSGVKYQDFEGFCLVAELIKNKAHLTEEGLNQIRLIKAGMNTGRKFS